MSDNATVIVDYVPIATDDASTGNTLGDPVTVPVLTNDVTGDLVDPTTVEFVGAPFPGCCCLTIPGEGTWSIDPTTGAITFTPLPGFTGDPTPIQYTVEDYDGNVSNPATVTVTYLHPPDITVTITAEPNIMHGITLFDIYVNVTELLSAAPTSGLITVFIPIDTRWIIDGGYDPSLTVIGLNHPVSNIDWTYSSNAQYHIFTTTTVIPALDDLAFGLHAKWSAGFIQGNFTITAQILSGSGGEIRYDNNVDSEKLDYFIN